MIRLARGHQRVYRCCPKAIQMTVTDLSVQFLSYPPLVPNAFWHFDHLPFIKNGRRTEAVDRHY